MEGRGERRELFDAMSKYHDEPGLEDHVGGHVEVFTRHHHHGLFPCTIEQHYSLLTCTIAQHDRNLLPRTAAHHHLPHSKAHCNYNLLPHATGHHGYYLLPCTTAISNEQTLAHTLVKYK